MTPKIRKDEDGSTSCSDAGEEGIQINKPLIKESSPKSYNWVKGRASALSARWSYLPHNLPAIEKHFVPLPESIPRAIWGWSFWR